MHLGRGCSVNMPCVLTSPSIVAKKEWFAARAVTRIITPSP